ncbi:MAG TPA: hypothetical protein VMT15_00105 [Bryobacteraceae bacterium]|nr:hypothetical protein [Bryobacteraceae bacterium]
MKLLLPLLLLPLAASAAEKLEIEKFALRQFEDGPALAASHEFLPGETVFWSFRIRGYRVIKTENEAGDEESRVKLAWTVRAADPKGVLIDKERSGLVETKVFEQDKEWTPRASDSFMIPPLAPAGTYRATVTVKDESGEAKAELEFKVKGDSIEPSETLTGRDVRFLRSQNDTEAMKNPAYHAGDTLWVRFDITGYKFGENNRFEVEYGLKILRANGQTMFNQPVAAKETAESFYPQHYVPGLLSLGLNNDLPKGTYTMVITMRDNLGNQTWEHREDFQVQ